MHCPSTWWFGGSIAITSFCLPEFGTKEEMGLGVRLWAEGQMGWFTGQSGMSQGCPDSPRKQASLQRPILVKLRAWRSQESQEKDKGRG